MINVKYFFQRTSRLFICEWIQATRSPWYNLLRCVFDPDKMLSLTSHECEQHEDKTEYAGNAFVQSFNTTFVNIRD